MNNDDLLTHEILLTLAMAEQVHETEHPVDPGVTLGVTLLAAERCAAKNDDERT